MRNQNYGGTLAGLGPQRSPTAENNEPSSPIMALMTGLHRQHCRLTVCIELVELTVSHDKIQITILILRRGALSTFSLLREALL